MFPVRTINIEATRLGLRALVLMAPILLAAAGPVSAADPGARERAFVRSLELFDAAKSPGDYRESARVLESILADGFRSGAVYYNLGNAYFPRPPCVR